MFTTSALAVRESVHVGLPFNTLRDFQAVSQAVTQSNVLVVHPSVGAKNVQELVALAKRKPGQLNFGSGGNATSGHLAGELFRMLAGIDVVHVPYKRGAGGARRHHRRAHALHLWQSGIDADARQGWPPEITGGHHHYPSTFVARRADGGGVRCARIRIYRLDGPVGTGEYTARDNFNAAITKPRASSICPRSNNAS